MDNQANVSRAEVDILLAEYKSHRDEIFKWFTYRHQAVAGYLVLLSTLGTIVASGDLLTTDMCVILIALVYLSLALLYVLLQFAFGVRSNARYIDKHLKPRIRQLCGSEGALEWECYNQQYRKKLGGSVFLLTKFSVEAIPHFVILVGLVALYMLEFVCKDQFGYVNAPCPWQKIESFLSGVFCYGLAWVLWVWMFCSSSLISEGWALRAKEWITRKVRGSSQNRAG